MFHQHQHMLLAETKVGPEHHVINLTQPQLRLPASSQHPRPQNNSTQRGECHDAKAHDILHSEAWKALVMGSWGATVHPEAADAPQCCSEHHHEHLDSLQLIDLTTCVVQEEAIPALWPLHAG